MTAEASNNNRLVVLTGALVLGGALALLVAWAIGAFDAQPLTGDEPPIRVRNGSIEFELLHPTHKFAEADGSTDKKNWGVDGGLSRRSNDVTVLVIPSTLSNCKGFVESGNKVEFYYTDNKKITVQSNGNKEIRVQNNDDPLDNPTNNRRFLRYDVGDVYIKRIDIGSKQRFCEFDAKDLNLQVFVLD